MSASASASGVGVPSRPGKLEIRSVSKTSISLSWAASRGHVRVAGYRIYVNGVRRASVFSTSYRVGQLRCGTNYGLAVRAYDAAGNLSRTTAIRATTAACSPTVAACTTTISSGLVSAVQNAAAGATLCLASGSYGDVSMTSVAKTADVTVQPASGASVTIGALDFQMVSHLRLTGLGGSMSVGGLDLDPVEGDPSWSHNLTFDHLTWTSALSVRTRGTNQALLFDFDVFDNLGVDLWEGRITVRGYGQTQPVGVTISNSHFAGGCSDGVQLIGDVYGVRVGPGNEFTNIRQSPCGTSVHADPIQGVGAKNILVTGNYFHDNGDGSGGIMGGQGDDGWTVTNNVFNCSCDYPWSIWGGGIDNWTIQHNVFVAGRVRFETADGAEPSGNVVRDNVFTTGGISTDGSNYGTNDHNLNAGVSGIGNLRGTPVFVGGKNPTSYAGYLLAPRSRGKGAASEHSDMGVRGSG